MLVPLATYPYLIRVLGRELYGYVITAQVISSYSSIFVNFGFRSVSARFISINRNNKEKLSDIVSAVLFVRIIIWFIVLIIYLIVIYSVQKYRDHYLLFLLSFGITFNELLFPQFFFQGIEKMKYITILRVLINSIFLVCIFIFIKDKSDYFIVPVFMSLGFLVSGILSFVIINRKEGVFLRKPSQQTIRDLIPDSFPIFLKDLITTIKDKFNYLLLGSFVGMDSVAIYDLGVKFIKLLVKPTEIIGTVLFPVLSRKKSISLFLKGALSIFLLTFFPTFLVYFFLPKIIAFFIPGEIDLFPLQLFLSVPLILALSSFISSNFLIAFGQSKYVLYSIIITTISYGFVLGYFYFRNELASINSFIIIAVVSYFTEFIYRLYIFFKKEKRFRDRQR